MQNLIKIGLRLPLILIIISLASCSSVPAPPSINTCIMSLQPVIANSYAVCVPSDASIQRGSLSAKDATHLVLISELQNYVMFSPSDWGLLEAWILKLKQQYKSQ